MKKRFDSNQKLQIDSEEKYRRLFELESDAIFLIDNETGDILEVNEAACKLYGFSYDALIKMKHTELSAEPHETRRVTLAGKTFIPVRWHRKKDQTVFPVEIVANHFLWQGRAVHIAAIRDITERLHAEESLRESEERSRSLIDHNPDAVYSLDAHGVFLCVNDSACRISGYSREELAHMNFDLLIVPEEKQGVWTCFKKALNGEPQNYETTILRKDQRQVIINVTNTPMIVKGKIVGVYGIAKDITERKRADEEIRSAHRDWENIFQAIGSPAVVLDPQHNIIAANHAVLHASGLSREEIIGRPCYEVFHGSSGTSPARGCPMERLLASGQPEGCPMEIEAFGGTYLVSCMPIFAKDGHIEKVIHIATDITDRVLAERALQESEEKYRSLFDHSTDAILLTKPDGTVLDANPAACKMFGRSQEEIVRIGRNGLVVRTDAHLHTALESRNAYGDATAEIMMLRANGEKFPVEITSAMFTDASGQQKISMIIRDITERREREEENKRISEKLRALAARLQAVREEERTRIAREIHDELGGALTGIKIDLALLIKEADAINEESMKRPLLDQMISTTRIIDKTVRTVRRIATELRPGILDDLGIIAALKWQLNDFQKRTGIHCHWTSSIENIDLDEHHLTALFRIFQETLTNVGRHANATEIKTQLKKETDTYVLEVQDNGKGITTGDMENKGSLGILGMRERALTFGGSIEIEGKSGKGTKVTVKIPAR